MSQTQDLGLSVDPAAGAPLYQQIADQIGQRIREGVLPPGFRLPPTRALAESLETNRNTVVRAFNELTDGGLLVSVVGRGTFVADELPAEAVAPTSRGALSWSSLVSRATDAGALHRVDRLGRRVTRSNMINLQRMQPSEDLLPVDPFRRCVQHVLRTFGPSALAYAPREGLPRLRRAVAEDLSRRGVPASADEVLITTGSQQALDLVARILIDPGDTFLVQDATYTGAIHVLAAAGARLVGVPRDEEGPDMQALELLGRAGAKGFYLMPNGQNPTGRSISKKRREALVAWSHRVGVPLIEDDYAADLDLDGVANPPALRALDAQVLHLGTFSKRLIPALRIGYLLCPPQLRPHLATLKHAMDLGSSLVLQHALAEFLDRGYLRAHLRRVLPLYRERRDALEGALARHLPDGVVRTRASRGLTAWLTLPSEVDPELAFAEAQRRGVLVSPDTLFSVSGGERGLRLTFCAEGPKRLAKGGRLLGQALTEVLAAPQSSGGTTLTVV